MSLRLTTAAGVAAVAVALVPGSADALTISGTSTKTLPDSKPISADARVTDVIYYLDLHAGPADERFSVTLRPGRFATSGSRDEGESVDGPLQFGLYGPGTVGEVVTDPQFGSVCSDRGNLFHGYATGDAAVDVFLPANANTTLAIRYKTGRRAPWADTDLRLRYAFQPKLVGTYDASSPLFGLATSVSGVKAGVTPKIPITSRGGARKIGAHMILGASPSGGYGSDAKPRSLKRSQLVRISGRLLPAISGKKIQLQWAKPGARLRTATTVRTGSGGRFTANVKAPGTGTYELWARYPSQPGPLASDTTSCPLTYRVR